jgi:hypothetical protein
MKRWGEVNTGDKLEESIAFAALQKLVFKPYAVG